MAYKMIQVGTGGFGGVWCRDFLPPNIKDGLVEVVAAVDVNPDALRIARKFLHLRDEQCYTDLREAFDANRADFCTVVVPPSVHEQVVDQALAHEMHILSEKPIADSLAASVRIAEKVKLADRKMGVTMSHRFDRDKTTLREELRSGRHGPLDYLICRFTCDCRQFGDWAEWRHEMVDPLMVEGAIHHLDILADLAGDRCEALHAQTWNPPWGEYAGDSQALVSMRFANGARALYEGAKTNAVGLNWWGHEYVRAECRDATLILNRRRLERFEHGSAGKRTSSREGTGTKIPLRKQSKWSNAWLIEKFVRWLDGGEAMETNVEDNLQSVAMVSAAICSSRTGQSVKVQELLADARASTDSQQQS